MSLTDVGFMRYYDQIEFAEGKWHDYYQGIECKADDPTENCDICLVWRTLTSSEEFTSFKFSINWQFLSNSTNTWGDWQQQWTTPVIFDQTLWGEEYGNPVKFNGKVGTYYSIRILHILNKAYENPSHGWIHQNDPIYKMVSGNFQNRSNDAVNIAIHIQGVNSDGSLAPLTAIRAVIAYSPVYELTSMYYATEDMFGITYYADGWNRVDDAFKVTRFVKNLDDNPITGVVQNLSEVTTPDTREELSGDGEETNTGVIYIPINKIPSLPANNQSVPVVVEFKPCWNTLITSFANNPSAMLTISNDDCSTPLVTTNFTNEGFLHVSVTNGDNDDCSPDGYVVKLESGTTLFDFDTKIINGSSGSVDFEFPPTGVTVDIKVVALKNNQNASEVLATVDTETLYLANSTYYILSPVSNPEIKVYARYNYTYDENYSFDTVEAKFNGRKFPSVFFGYGGTNDVSIKFEIPNGDIDDGMPEPVEQLAKLKYAASLGKCVLSDTLGNRKLIVITGVSPSYEYNSCKWSVSLDMSEVD